MVLCACGRIAFEPVGTPGVAPDAAPDSGVAAACEAAWLAGPTVSAVQPLTALNSAVRDFAPFLTADGLTIYFSSERSGDYQIYSAVRPALDQPFGDPELVGGDVNLGTTTQLTLSRDGLEAFLSTSRGGQPDIMRAVRASPLDPLTGFELVPNVSTPGDEYNAVLSYDERTLYFAAVDRGGSVGYDVWRAERAGRGAPFSAPELVPLSSGIDDAAASEIATGRVLVFAHLEDDTGSLDIWYATRGSTSEPYGPGRPIAELSTAMFEYTPYLRHDGCEIIFAIAIQGANDDLYSATILPP